MQLSRVPIEDLGPVIDRLWDIIPQCTGGAATLLEQIASQEKCIHSFVARGAKKEKVPLQSNDDDDDDGYDAASSTDWCRRRCISPIWPSRPSYCLGCPP